MLELPLDARLAGKARARDIVAARLGTQLLERHVAADLAIEDERDLAHAAGAEQALLPVALLGGGAEVRGRDRLDVRS